MRPAESARRTVNPTWGSARPLLKRCEANRPRHHRHQPETTERLEVQEKKTSHQDRGHRTGTGRGARPGTGTGHRAATGRAERRRSRQPTATAGRPDRTRRTSMSARHRPDRTARCRRHRRGVRPDGSHSRVRPDSPERALDRQIGPRSVGLPRTGLALRRPARPLTPNGHGERPARGERHGRGRHATGASHRADGRRCRQRGRHRHGGVSGRHEDSRRRSRCDGRGRPVIQRRVDDRIRTGRVRRRRRHRLHRTPRALTATSIRAVTPTGVRAAGRAAVRGAAPAGGRSRPGAVAGRRGRIRAGLRPRRVVRRRRLTSRAGALGRSALVHRLAAAPRSRAGIALGGGVCAVTVAARRARAAPGGTRARLLRRGLPGGSGGACRRCAVGRRRGRCRRGARGRRGGRRGRTRGGSRGRRRSGRSRDRRLGARRGDRASSGRARRGHGGRDGVGRAGGRAAPGPRAAGPVGHRDTRRDGAERGREQQSARKRTAEPRSLSAQTDVTAASHGDPQNPTRAPPVRWQGCLHHRREYASSRREERAPCGSSVHRSEVYRTVRRPRETVHRTRVRSLIARWERGFPRAVDSPPNVSPRRCGQSVRGPGIGVPDTTKRATGFALFHAHGDSRHPTCRPGAIAPSGRGRGQAQRSGRLPLPWAPTRSESRLYRVVYLRICDGTGAGHRRWARVVTRSLP